MRKAILLGLVLLGLCFFLPEIASRTFAKKQLIAHLETQLGGKVQVEQVSLSWWKGQKCKNVEWVHPTKGFVCKSEELEMHAGLIECLRLKDTPLDVTVKGASLHSQADLIFLKAKKKKGLLLEFPLIQARVENGAISFGHTDVKINGKMDMHTKGKIDLGKNRIDVTLGIPAKMLRKVIGIKEIPDFFVLELPISTTLSSKSIEQELILSLLNKKNLGITHP